MVYYSSNVSLVVIAKVYLQVQHKLKSMFCTFKYSYIATNLHCLKPNAIYILYSTWLYYKYDVNLKSFSIINTTFIGLKIRPNAKCERNILNNIETMLWN